MKLKILALVTTIVTTLSCKDTSTNKSSRNNDNIHPQSQPGVGDSFIPIDSANKMLASYLASINHPDKNNSLKSIIIDASSLRNYLNDTTNGRIDKVKIMFAHTLDYINSGHEGQNARYKPGALTLIFAGYDAVGNYIYYDGMVLDHGAPCPIICPPGEAASDLLIQ